MLASVAGRSDNGLRRRRPQPRLLHGHRAGHAPNAARISRSETCPEAGRERRQTGRANATVGHAHLSGPAAGQNSGKTAQRGVSKCRSHDRRNLSIRIDVSAAWHDRRVSSTASSTVERAFRAALYAETDTALDTGASLLAADPAADDELARRGREFVATAWRRGWQPADVVRIVRRELDDVHVRLASALIRAQSAGRPPARPPLDRAARRAHRGSGRATAGTATAHRPLHARDHRPGAVPPAAAPARPRTPRRARRGSRSRAGRRPGRVPHAHPHPRAARQGGGDRLPGGGGGAHRQGAGADGPAQHRRGAARRPGAAPGRPRRVPDRRRARRTSRRRRCCWTRSPPRTTAGPCGTSRSASPPSSASRPTWRWSSSSTPRSSCRPRRR